MGESYIYDTKIGINENRAIWDEERLNKDEKHDHPIKKWDGGTEWKRVKHRKMKSVYYKMTLRTSLTPHKEIKKRILLC